MFIYCVDVVASAHIVNKRNRNKQTEVRKMQFLLDVVGVVGSTQSVVYEAFNSESFNYVFQLENLSTGVVVVQGQQSVDGVTWTNVGAATTLEGSAADASVYGGTDNPQGEMVTVTIVAKQVNFRLVVNRGTGSTAVGLVKGARLMPDWAMAREQNSVIYKQEVPFFQACATACQDDCQLASIVACQSLCEIAAQTAYLA